MEDEEKHEKMKIKQKRMTRSKREKNKYDMQMRFIILLYVILFYRLDKFKTTTEFYEHEHVETNEDILDEFDNQNYENSIEQKQIEVKSSSEICFSIVISSLVLV